MYTTKRCYTCKRDSKIESVKPFPGREVLKLSCGHNILRFVPENNDRTVGLNPDRNRNRNRNNVLGSLSSEARQTALQVTSSDKVKAKPSNDAFWNKLYKYQQECVKFAEEANFNCIFADPAGMGKTIEALAVIHYHKKELTPTLFIVKSKLRYQWATEIYKWLGEPPILVESPVFLELSANYFVVSMDYMPKILQEILDKNFKALVIDECQNFKTPGRKRTDAFRELTKAVGKNMLLTGTPILNRFSEYFTALQAVNPKHWPYREHFIRMWCDVDSNGRPTGILRQRRTQFFNATKNYILRRNRDDYLDSLPKISHNMYILDVEDPLIIDRYENERLSLNKLIERSHEVNPLTRRMHILAMIVKLRQTIGIAKVPYACEFISRFLEDNPKEKIIVGINHVTVRAGLMQGLAKYLPVRIDGDTDEKESRRNLLAFQQSSHHRILLASTIAAGEGLDGIQTVCSNAVILEREWNPGRESQFIGRIHRNLQTKPINIFYLVARGSIDEWISELVEKKRLWINSADNLMDEDSSQATMEIDWLKAGEEIGRLSIRRKD